MNTAFSITDLTADTLKIVRDITDKCYETNAGMLKIKPAKMWIEDAKIKPVPQMLFSELWYEGEVCIMFADTNLGKSILAVQIADSISRGQPIPGFKLGVNKQKVIYLDFEMSDKQFERRYSIDYQDHFEFDPNFLRSEFDRKQYRNNPFKTYEEFILHSIKEAISKTEAKVLILDNMTYLRTDTEKAKDASPLMQDLQDMAEEFGISLLVLAHTPKRDSSRPITNNDLQGSKMLSNFCDSLIAIGESTQGRNIRYIKQTKSRSGEKMYDSESVFVCEVVKPDNFLHFKFLGFGLEGDHLKHRGEQSQEGLSEKVKFFQSEEGGKKSIRQIGLELGISKSTIERISKK